MKFAKSQQSIIKKILKKHNVQFGYVFGSRATGKGVIRASDLDIAVFFGTGSSYARFIKRLKLITECAHAVSPIPVDVVVLDDIKDIDFRYTIISEGICIINTNDDRRIDYEFRTMNEYEEFEPFLSAYNQEYIRQAV